MDNQFSPGRTSYRIQKLAQLGLHFVLLPYLLYFWPQYKTVIGRIRGRQATRPMQPVEKFREILASWIGTVPFEKKIL